jgi:hypothetical protein
MGDEAPIAADRARTALAERLEIPAEAIEVLEVAPAQWPNSALGCPEKGRVYAQVMTSGYRVLLGHEGRSQWLHVTRKKVVTCGGASGGASGRALRGSTLEAMIRISREARRDLAQRLGIDEADVRIERFRHLKEGAPPDGCPADAEPTSGESQLQITLQASGQTHEYRGIGERLVFCETP